MSGSIPKDFITEIVDMTDIISLVESYLPLKKKGKDHFGQCPFCDDGKNPSFSVSDQKQFYYCFKCRATGNVIGFLQSHQGYDFIESIEALAARAGVEVPYENNKSSSLDKKKFFKELMIDERKDLFVWGAGHTGREIISSTKSLPLNRYWIDISRERFPALIDDDVHAIWANEPENLAKNLPNGGIHLVLTHSHALDLAIIQSLLKGNKFYKLGLIGSKTKKTRFKNQLSKAGFSPIDIEKIICPIGLPEIQGDEPFRIALSVAGQISNWTL